MGLGPSFFVFCAVLDNFMAWYVSLNSWPLGVGSVGLFMMRPWLSVLCCCFLLIVWIVGMGRLGL